MNYLKQILALNELQLITPLSQGQFMLYHALLDVNNKCFWKEWFEVANSRLEAYTALTRQSISKARNELKQKGLIDFKTNGTKATSYKIIQLYSEKEEECQPTCQINRQAGLQVGLQQVDKLVDNKLTIGLQDGCTLIKQNKTKLNKTKSNISPTSVDDVQAPTRKPSKASQLEADFDKLWKLYPKKARKADALKAYKQALKAGVTNKEIQDGIVAYIKQIEVKGTPMQYVAQGGTWFNQKRWMDEYDLTPNKPVNRYGRENYQEKVPDWFERQQEERKKVAPFVAKVDQSTADDLKARIEALNLKQEKEDGDG
ncbi:hypothetical protein HMPREF3187_01576 [Aerococcus christensenii]|uniref:DnaD domain protein n=1 Tax=Aerococcus christensenii TaxID=87541 RepID=A0A133XSQ9_9LACT|nr:helix-turn-helix domain-containing protein [Aerococcus christensenii]KXB33967.1 hypothetical protein HMPREF3187_01576 [Aerococcus christensenii]DAK63172.1 MAG TPA: replisome organizer protein [Caudoviricetes sp.]